VRIGLLGYGWIARAHAHALLTLEHVAPVRIELKAVAGRNPEKVATFAAELGFARSTTRWHDVAEADDVDVVVVATPVEAHAEAVAAAIRAGKPTLCEKPLGVDAAEAGELAQLAEATGITGAVGFNYRYVPAVTLAKELVDSGRIGPLRHFRGLYLQDFKVSPTVPWTPYPGAGAVLDYIHLADMLLFLGAEPESVQAQTSRFGSETVDQYAAVFALRGEATATLEASRVALGWKGHQRIELNGTEGSLWWDLEDLNRLHVYLAADEREGLGGYRDVLVTNPDHPFLDLWWTPGHILGWEHAMVHQWRDFLTAVLEGGPVAPRQASFEDGRRAAVIADAIVASARSGTRVAVDTRAPAPEPTSR